MRVNEPDALSKTTRVNLLFDFYEPLLTDKQRSFLKYYYHDDFSLGEIASEFGISRQAVYDNVRRAEQAIEGYESKLGLVARHERLVQCSEQLENDIRTLVMDESVKERLATAIRQLRASFE